MGEELGMRFGNRQVVLNNYVKGSVVESDMSVRDSAAISAEIPNDAILLKNLYLSCDPYMLARMKKLEGHYVESFTLGSVSEFMLLLLFFSFFVPFLFFGL